MTLIAFSKVSKNNDLHHDIDHLQNNADHHTCKVRAIIAAAIGALALVPVCFVVHLGQCWCYYAWGCSHINQSPTTILILPIFWFDILMMKVCGYDLPFTGGSWAIGGRDCRRTRLWVPGREIDHDDGRSHLAIIMNSKADEDAKIELHQNTLTWSVNIHFKLPQPNVRFWRFIALMYSWVPNLMTEEVVSTYCEVLLEIS